MPFKMHEGWEAGHLSLSDALEYRGKSSVLKPITGRAYWIQSGKEALAFEFIIADSPTKPGGLDNIYIELYTKSGLHKAININGKRFAITVDEKKGDYVTVSREALQTAFAKLGTSVTLIDQAGLLHKLSYSHASYEYDRL